MGFQGVTSLGSERIAYKDDADQITQQISLYGRLPYKSIAAMPYDSLVSVCGTSKLSLRHLPDFVVRCETLTFLTRYVFIFHQFYRSITQLL